LRILSWFRIRARGICFLQVMDAYTGQGDIELTPSRNALSWAYRQIVLDEPFRLSFPYGFEWEREYYMIPESSEVNAIRLYETDPFSSNESKIR
jgi:hypothetical protein